MKETEVAAPVVAWLQKQGWDVYQEVENGNVADIVARMPLKYRDDLIWVIETKTTLSLALLDQAIAWTPWAHLVSVAVPAPKTMRRGTRAINLVLQHYKLGFIEVDTFSGYKPVREVETPGLHRIVKCHVRNWDRALVEEQKTYCPAGTQGGHWTPFKGTCKRLRGYVEKHPGCLMKEAVEGIRHHYQTEASAIGSLRYLVQDGVVPGVRFERDGRKIRLYSEVSDA